MEGQTSKLDQAISLWEMSFLDKTCKKLGPKEKSDHHHRILYIRNSLGIKFQRKQKILDFLIKLIQDRYFQSKIKREENHHRILHIRISLAAKFQLQQIILIF